MSTGTIDDFDLDIQLGPTANSEFEPTARTSRPWSDVLCCTDFCDPTSLC
ncbi:hypothetical protein ACI2LF_17015 [Kribbella sp. NPDC020789]